MAFAVGSAGCCTNIVINNGGTGGNALLWTTDAEDLGLIPPGHTISLSFVPASIHAIRYSINGTYLRPGLDFTLTGSIITNVFGRPFPTTPNDSHVISYPYNA